MIVTQFDRNYLRWGRLFLRSLAVTNPAEPVWMDTVNLTEAACDELGNLHPRVTIQNHLIAPAPDREFMANRRVDVFLGIFQTTQADRFLFMDADMLFRQPLDRLFAKVDEADAALVFRSGYYEGQYSELMRVACGVILVTRRLGGRMLMEEWHKRIHGDQPLHGVQPGKWWWDQISLWTVAQELQRGGMRCETIEEQVYCNRYMPASAAIWSANLPHQKEQQFQRFTAETLRLEGK